MRKWIQRIMVFSICMVLLTVSSINAFASMVTVDEEVSSEVSTTNSARSSFTLSIVPGEKFYAQSSWMYIGFSPTIKVTGRGNPDLQYRVRVQGCLVFLLEITGFLLNHGMDHLITKLFTLM